MKTGSVRLPRGALGLLRTADPRLGRVVERVGPFRLVVKNDEGPLCALVRAIVFQQLSGKAAETIYGRLRGLYPPGKFPTAKKILGTSDEAIRGCGISGQKLGYLRDLCQRVEAQTLDLEALLELDDDAVIDGLTKVRGIGRWSAQMFLMFYLGRLDVWPEADLGIRSAVRLLHFAEQEELPSIKAMPALGERYRPYASVASWYLWRLLELPADERTALLTDEGVRD